ncbi:hypothetical protein B566_EDAN003760 [Ephemera danica]|nr:hypothetical protein B566_EDAN003760 [Ephemera danica]
MAKIYSYIRSIGGITIADEIQTGMGRCGSHFWAFQTQQDAVPDIVTVGKPLGNGYPIAAVITSKKIASAVFRTGCKFNCDPVGASIGLAVLETIKTEKILEHTTEMSKKIFENMLKLKAKSCIIGDVRCIGLMVGVDIVWSKESRKPSSELAEKISYRLKDKHIIVANEGEYNNVLNFMPPLCVTAQDFDTLDFHFERILSDIEFENSDDIFNILQTNQPSSSHQSNYNHTYPSTSSANWTQQRSDNNTISDDSNDSTVDPSYDSMD